MRKKVEKKMSKIEELLENEKVEWKAIGDVPQISVASVSKKLKKQEYLNNGKYPIIDQGQEFIVGYTNDSDIILRDYPYVIFGDHTESIKYADFSFAQGADGIKILKTDETYITARYLYHVILNYYKPLGKYMRHFAFLKKTMIPIPSPETQKKIVEILDNFTNCVMELQAELQAELQNRTKQYEYYTNMLLSEEYLNKLSDKLGILPMEAENHLRCTTLGEIGKFTRGNGLQKGDFIPSGKPAIHYGQIYTKFGFETNQAVSFISEELFNKLKKAKPKDILIATTSENIEDVGKCLVWAGEEEVAFSGDMYSYSTTENSKYIAYYFQTSEFQRQKEKKVTGTKLIRIHGDDMEKFSINVPSLPLQNKIVEILDKFQSMLSDTKGLLPKEIEQRRKQYEYYREKLLTFDIESDSKQASKQASKQDNYKKLL